MWIFVGLAACIDYGLHAEEVDPVPPAWLDHLPDQDGDAAGRVVGWDTAEAAEDACELASRLTGFLDQFQVPGDGRVVFCHSGSGDDFHQIESDIDACSAHLDHEHDLFPTTGCDS